jgi:hypothetical protein
LVETGEDARPPLRNSRSHAHLEALGQNQSLSAAFYRIIVRGLMLLTGESSKKKAGVFPK